MIKQHKATAFSISVGNSVLLFGPNSTLMDPGTATHTFLSTSNWESLPITPSTIEQLNSLAAKDPLPANILEESVPKTSLNESNKEFKNKTGKEEVLSVKEEVLGKSALSRGKEEVRAESATENLTEVTPLIKSNQKLEVTNPNISVIPATETLDVTDSSVLSSLSPQTDQPSGPVPVEADKAIINNESILRRTQRLNAGKLTKMRWGDEYAKQKDEAANKKKLHQKGEESNNFHISVAKGLREVGEPVEKAIEAELQQFINLQVFEPVKYSSAQQRNKILRSSMFITEKLDGAGKHLKWKARMVADGSMQDKKLYLESSSSTIDAVAVKAILKIAAVEKRNIMVIDVTGAYLHAKMDQEIYMLIKPNIASILAKLSPAVNSFRCKDGGLIVRLLKALYGCRQSGKLWYERFTEFLKRLGFCENPAQKCVWNLLRNEKQITLGFHVDDNLVTSENAENLDWFLAEMKKEFLDIKIQEGAVKQFLGMLVDSTRKEKITLCMNQLTKECLEGISFNEKAATPALDDIFEKHTKIPLLTGADHKEFHSRVAKLRYLAENVRPDLNLVAAVLSTRVSNPNLDDVKKLHRALCYLNSTKDLKLIIDNSSFDSVHAYVDAAFAKHSDVISHTGMVLTLGNTAVMFKSKKQKLVTTSSTTAELVGLHDMKQHALSLAEFLQGQGYTLKPSVLLQDNEPVIKIVASNGRMLKNVYMRTKQADIKAIVKKREAILQHIGTKKMIADLLTKPLHGEQFRELRNKALGGGALDVRF